MKTPDRSIAFVLPWFGQDVPGGAETDARHLVQHLRGAGVPVEVWTTCAAGSNADWNKNRFQPGRFITDGVPVTRFPVTRVNRDSYPEIHRRLARGRRVTPDEEARFFAQSIRSQRLIEHIRTHPGYVCVFTPYLYGTTYWGAYVAPERSLLVPCLHDEGFARMASLGHLFRCVRGIVCYSRAEKQLVQRLYGVSGERLALKGAGIDVSKRGDGQSFRARYGLSAPFVLYVGRKATGKNTPLLLNYFCRYHRRRNNRVGLVLIGAGHAQIPHDCRTVVHNLGFVSEQEKQDAYAAATLFCQPSVNESFSIVLMEAWVQETPALVNGRCNVTREHCRLSQGGLYFNSYQEFEAEMDLLLADGALRQKLGASGRSYVEQNFTWRQVTAQFIDALRNLVL